MRPWVGGLLVSGGFIGCTPAEGPGDDGPPRERVACATVTEDIVAVPDQNNSSGRSRVVERFDEEGLLLHHARFVGAELQLAEQREYTYNNAGEPLNIVTDWGGWGETAVFTYDAEGRLVEHIVTTDPVGDLRERYAFTYDADGRLHTRTAFSLQGTVFSVAVYTYDAAGRQVQHDIEVLGTPSHRFTFEHDARGNVVLEREDDFSVGSGVDRVTANTWDNADRLLFSARDFRSVSEEGREAREVPDGLPDATTTYTYVDALLVEIQDAYLETDATDFRLTRRTTYTHQADGRVQLAVVDWQSDGEPDHTSTFSYEDCP